MRPETGRRSDEEYLFSVELCARKPAGGRMKNTY